MSPGDGRPSAAGIASAVKELGLEPLASGVAERFAAYLDLLLRWNAKLNLTAIRQPDEILRRHFLECIFCAQRLPAEIHNLLDYGSGAGFPGLPIALCRREIRVTLAESQGKKAGFLREAVRVLGVEAEVYSGRVEEMGAGRVFDGVALRAVDRMPEAIRNAGQRVKVSGWLVLLAGADSFQLPNGFTSRVEAMPGLERGVLLLAQRGS